MKGRRRRNLIGRACGVVAAVILVLWAIGPWYLNIAATSSDRRWGVWIVSGAVEVIYTDGAKVTAIEWLDPKHTSVALACHMGNDTSLETFPQFITVRPVNWQWRSYYYRFNSYIGQRWWRPGTWTGTYGQRGWRVPFWCFAAPLLCVALATELPHRRRQKRERMGRCPACNYDRTGLAKEAVCPECGKRP